MTRVFRTLRNTLIGAALAMAPVGAAQAATIDVTFDNNVYTIETLTGSFTDNQTRLLSTPWWGNESGADLFVNEVGLTFGQPNAGLQSTTGPFFAFGFAGLNTSVVRSRGLRPAGSGFLISTPSGPVSNERTFAAVQSVAPIPLPPAAALLFGGLGVLTFVKRRRA